MVINIYYPWYLKNNKDKIAEVCSHVNSALLDKLYYEPTNVGVNIESVNSHKFKQLIDETRNADFYFTFYIHTEANKDIAFGFI